MWRPSRQCLSVVCIDEQAGEVNIVVVFVNRLDTTVATTTATTVATIRKDSIAHVFMRELTSSKRLVRHCESNRYDRNRPLRVERNDIQDDTIRILIASSFSEIKVDDDEACRCQTSC